MSPSTISELLANPSVRRALQEVLADPQTRSLIRSILVSAPEIWIPLAVALLGGAASLFGVWLSMRSLRQINSATHEQNRELEKWKRETEEVFKEKAKRATKLEEGFQIAVSIAPLVNLVVAKFGATFSDGPKPNTNESISWAEHVARLRLIVKLYAPDLLKDLDELNSSLTTYVADVAKIALKVADKMDKTPGKTEVVKMQGYILYTLEVNPIQAAILSKVRDLGDKLIDSVSTPKG